MTEQQKTDLDLVLNFVTFTATPGQIESYEAEHGCSPADLDAALKRLGEAIGLDAGIL